MKQPTVQFPKLPQGDAGQIHAHNQFLHTCPHRQIAQTDFVLEASDLVPLNKFPLLLALSFQNQHEMKIGFRNIPFIKDINALCAPWTLPELSPELARAALTHILNNKLKALPETIHLQDWHLNISPPKDLAIHIGCELKNSHEKIQLAVWTHADFPFSELSAELNLIPFARKSWPPQLYVRFPIDIAEAQITAKDLPTLARGDVILLSPCR